MNNRTTGRAALWREVLVQPALWWRGILIGVSVGSLQVAINQGDFWWSGSVDARVVFKTALTPLITGSVAVFSAAWADLEQRRGDPIHLAGDAIRNHREGCATSLAVHNLEG